MSKKHKLATPSRFTHVILCVTLNADLNPDWFQEFVNIRLVGRDFLTEIMTTRGFMADSARNTAAWKMISDTKADYLMFLDSDNIAPPDVISRLLAHKKDVVCGLYPLKDRPFLPVMYKYWKRKEQNNGKALYHNIMEYERGALLKVDGAGTGCMMIHRRVFEKIPPPWFSFTEGGTEDMFFCRKLEEHGFDLWVDTSLEVGHARSAVVTMGDYLAQLKLHGKDGLMAMMADKSKLHPWDFKKEDLVADEGKFREVAGGQGSGVAGEAGGAVP